MYQQFTPYNYGYASPYQQRLNQLEQQGYQPPVQAPQGPQNVQGLKGRVVASIEEARASQVDFDGSATYFVCPGEQKIYAKSIGLNGLPVFLTYELSANQNEKNEEKIQKNDFDKRLLALEAKVKEISDGLNATVTTTE